VSRRDSRPRDWHLHYNLGALLHQLDRSAEAADQFDFVVRTFPHLAPFHVLLGYALDKTGRTDQAVAQFRLALRCDPHCKEAREALNQAREMKRRTGR
jgi:Flp pilus assembly protein TadD